VRKESPYKMGVWQGSGGIDLAHGFHRCRQKRTTSILLQAAASRQRVTHSEQTQLSVEARSLELRDIERRSLQV
jgi:hypothetical protein